MNDVFEVLKRSRITFCNGKYTSEPEIVAAGYDPSKLLRYFNSKAVSGLTLNDSPIPTAVLEEEEKVFSSPRRVVWAIQSYIGNIFADKKLDYMIKRNDDLHNLSTKIEVLIKGKESNDPDALTEIEELNLGRISLRVLKENLQKEFSSNKNYIKVLSEKKKVLELLSPKDLKRIIDMKPYEVAFDWTYVPLA